MRRGEAQQRHRPLKHKIGECLYGVVLFTRGSGVDRRPLLARNFVELAIKVGLRWSYSLASNGFESLVRRASVDSIKDNQLATTRVEG